MQKYSLKGYNIYMFQMPNFLISRHGLSPAVQMGEKTDCSLYNISGELIDNDVGI